MSYLVSLNIVDVRQVFEGRLTEWKSKGLPSFSMNRGQATANPRLQQLQSNVAGWQGGESQPPRATWSSPCPMLVGVNTLEKIKKQHAKNTAELENVVQTVQALRASCFEYQEFKRQWEEEKKANEENLQKIQGLIERMVAHFPQGETTIDPSLAFPSDAGDIMHDKLQDNWG